MITVIFILWHCVQGFDKDKVLIDRCQKDLFQYLYVSQIKFLRSIHFWDQIPIDPSNLWWMTFKIELSKIKVNSNVFNVLGLSTTVNSLFIYFLQLILNLYYWFNQKSQLQMLEVAIFFRFLFKGSIDSVIFYSLFFKNDFAWWKLSEREPNFPTFF